MQINCEYKEEFMKLYKQTLLLAAALILTIASVASAGLFQYTAKHPHAGGDVTPPEAYALLQKDTAHTFLIDVRTRAEYQYVGHPEGAYNIPIQFMTTAMGKKGYNTVANENFGKNLFARFNPKTDTLILMCRSGGRSIIAIEAAIKAGWPADRIFNMLGGFEGDKLKNTASAHNGKRIGGSWRNEGLPWTYGMDTKLVYQPDLAAH
jgi:rhodanese-related sulfurtransferase